MSRQPRTKQRSPYTLDPEVTAHFRSLGAEPDIAAFVRNVHDGTLVALRGTVPDMGMHLSVTHKRPNGEPGRYPSWDEIAHARDELLPADRDFVLPLPRDEDYIAIFPTTFHLHEMLPPGTTLLGERWWSVLVGTDVNGEVVIDDHHRLVAFLQPYERITEDP